MNEGTKKLTDYKNGDVTPFGMEIVKIIDASERAIVFWDKTGLVSYIYDNLKIDPNPVIGKYKDLYGILPKDIPEKIYKRVLSELGSCLFHAFNSETDQEAINYFSHIQKKIKRIKTPKEIKAYFIVLAIVTCSLMAIFLGLLFLWLGTNTKNWSVVFICAASGTVGALFSILQRNQEIDFDLTIRDLFIFMQVLSHAFFGAFSGSILFVASKANLAFGFAQENIYTLITLCVIAGFSERFIPEMFEKIATNAGNNNS